MWIYIDAAKTAGEPYGRALVVIAAQQHASELVVPASQRARPISYGSHRDHAENALAKLAGPHLPATLKQLKKAIDVTDREYNDRITALSNPGHDPDAEALDSTDIDVDGPGRLGCRRGLRPSLRDWSTLKAAAGPPMLELARHAYR